MKYAKLIFKNILRNKRRTLLTISSLVVSLFLIISLATILTEFDRGTDEASPLRLVSRHAVSLGFVIPMAHLQKIKTVPGVKEAMPFSWFGGIYKDERNFFANFAVDARKMRDVIPELKMSDADWQAFINDRQGAMVGANAKAESYADGLRARTHADNRRDKEEYGGGHCPHGRGNKILRGRERWTDPEGTTDTSRKIYQQRPVRVFQ